jgi:glycerol-3-phosphate dehydrogenase
MPDAPPAISALDRGKQLARLAQETFDLAVIGGGITGAGIARAASAHGLSVALLEAHDFAAGTSSRSSKLIHGGLRYLARGDVRVVREAALERKAVRRLAPHLAEPQWVLLPTARWLAQVPLRVGITLYEWLGQVDAAERHRAWRDAELSAEEPHLRRREYPHVTAYREYTTDDARLVLANLRAAVAAGACVASYAPVIALRVDAARAHTLVARCAGARLGDGADEISIRARCIVNAAGPWAESVRWLERGRPQSDRLEASRRDPDAAVPPAMPRWLHLSKGIHIVLPRSRLPLRHVHMLRAADRRLIFAIPRGAVTYVGTTDRTYPQAEVWPEITRAEVEYLLEPLPRYFAVDPFSPGDVVASWAGLRPLIARPGRPPGELSRRNEVEIGPAGVISIAGGKLTGYRPMAHEVLARALAVLGTSVASAGSHVRGRMAGVAEAALPGGDFAGDVRALASRLCETHGCSFAAALRLARLYGAEAEAVLSLGSAPLPGAGPDGAVLGEVEWAVRQEGALHLEDVIYRRTRLGVYGATTSDLLDAVAPRMATLLDWRPADVEAEVTAVAHRLAADLAFR